ncbi:MAG: NAD-dependent epimerase/dehydratase [Candidatus Woesebacteria bacterium GW2011_GWB1_44_11]|uniref:UDP-glucuronate decarboxylase n=2 Tax=Candidatus Woeseibacteriota TaxID=1752722 RepID=A0A1F8DIL2_9BACT|nr:MAG: NAD-dependent epimerase/dehydratase [Candidatus Woesebacteria bacterium GW2011_GWB1_44_11]OGM83675.1 MAG: NAD-dependent dehydratase [Candidatus Woesebacteria bacterium RIFOXYC1_FULL_43_18]OGM87869.1 MAG: NAD-dependent dehydratase [Candidatus Woesebacteria bacterium RIFOXYD1_FULL_43_18]
MQSILVTGGAGFIGSHLCDLLIDKKYKVICLDNLLTGSKNNIEHLLKNPNFQFIEADVVKPISRLADQQVDYIFHLASPASPIDYQNYPEETLLSNSVGTLNVLELAKNTGPRALITSTSEIYGDPREHPQKETYFGNVNTFGPRACYDESKRYAEAATYVYIQKYNLNARIVRIFNTYGPRMQKDDGRVVSNFINGSLSGETLTIDGDGSQTRSFCYVSDMVDGIFKAMFSDDTNGEIFNLGNPDEYTVKDLAHKIIDLTGSKSEIKYSGNFREDDPMRRQPDITKAKKILNWEPVVTLDEGLRKTIEYYKSL